MIGRKASLAVRIGAVVGLVGSFFSDAIGSEAPTRTLEVLSPVYTVDREYRSMRGPVSTQTVAFPEKENRELVWVTAYRAEMVGADGATSMPQEFMCHSNLDFDAERHGKLLWSPFQRTDRLFTLSQGQFEIELPKGFGLPFYSDEEFSLTTQVLNLNDDGRAHEVRHKVAIRYVRDADLDEPMKPLFKTAAWGLVRLDPEAGHYGVAEPNESEHGEGCLPGTPAGTDLYEDEHGQKFSGHWVVPPGRQVNRTLVTRIMQIPYDTTVHYIAVHLHPFAESLELLDLTAGKSVFKSDVEGSVDKIGIDRVQYFSSEEGIPVFRDHEYELVSTYDNTTSEDQDSMAVMLLYLLDKHLKPIERDSVTVKHVDGSPHLSEKRVVFHTSFGDITMALYPEVAPNHVAQFVDLVESGVYDTTSFFRVDPGFVIQTGWPTDRSGAPLTREQRAAIRPLRAELSDLPHRRGVLSMALQNNSDPHSAETSFSILLGDAPHLDRKYTIFGHVVAGFDTIDAILGARRADPKARIEIRSAEVTSARVTANRSSATAPRATTRGEVAPEQETLGRVGEVAF